MIGEAIPDWVAEQSLVILTNDDWHVGVPRTLAAAAWWGYATNWCTRDDESAFNVYVRDGNLVVFRHRPTWISTPRGYWRVPDGLQQARQLARLCDAASVDLGGPTDGAIVPHRVV